MTYIEQGGWLIWPIIIASVVAMAIVFERLWVLRRAAVVSRPMLEKTQDIAMASPAQAVNLCDRSVLGQLFAEAAQAPPQRSQREAVMAAQGPAVAQRLERNLELLGVIAAVAPLMGLLGTVVGMIDVFAALMIHGAGDASVLAGGIGQALVTTAVGLVVAIPPLIAHRLLQRRAQSFLHEIEAACERFLSVDPGYAETKARAA